MSSSLRAELCGIPLALSPPPALSMDSVKLEFTRQATAIHAPCATSAIMIPFRQGGLIEGILRVCYTAVGAQWLLQTGSWCARSVIWNTDQ